MAPRSDQEYAIITKEEIIFTPLVVSNIFKRAMSHLYFKTDLEERKYNFRDRCTMHVQLYETIALPDSVSVEYIPAITDMSGTGASFKGYFTIEDNKLKVGANLKFKKRIYKPDDWGSFREAVASQNRMANEPVILRIESEN